ncbi:MAG TPA: hypothetical protein VFE33_13960 [Thermoanaerobaculia bacterium]|nr:hypothetical protein [Thermoanaerobaculia bacterium]
MFRFLVVEDESVVLAQLQTMLGETFPHCEVATASTVATGESHIESGRQAGWAYDAAILDFKLPRYLGENPEVDSSLSRKIQELNLPTLVAHVTGFTGDQAVREHVRRSQVEQPNPRAFTLSKEDPNWASVLVSKLKTFLYGSRIERQLKDLFGMEAAGDTLLRRNAHRSNVARTDGGTTHRLAGLFRDIEAHWTDLDPGLQKRISDILEVDVSSGECRVSLL